MNKFFIYLLLGLFVTIIFKVVDNKTKKMGKQKRLIIRCVVWALTTVIIALVYTSIQTICN